MIIYVSKAFTQNDNSYFFNNSQQYFYLCTKHKMGIYKMEMKFLKFKSPN